MKRKSEEALDTAKKSTKEIFGKVANSAVGLAGNAQKALATGKDKAADAASEAKKEVVQRLDANGDGQVDVQDLIILGMRTPGIAIDREKFLRREFQKRYGEEVIAKAVSTTPHIAGISEKDVDTIADAVIQNERLAVSGISAALSAPGGAAMAATIPTDIIQYYGYMLRTAQKLMYLYGFPAIETEDGTEIDTPTMNLLILALGVMFGVGGANNAVRAMAKALGGGVEKQLMKKALTKGAVYPVVKGIAKWFGVHMTKEIYTGIIGKSIPAIGAVVGGGITYATFKPCCDKLKSCLKDTELSNSQHHADEAETVLYEELVGGEETVQDEEEAQAVEEVQEMQEVQETRE